MALAALVLVAWWCSTIEEWWAIVLIVLGACVAVPMAIWSVMGVALPAQILDVIQGGLYRLPITLFLAFFFRSRRREKKK